MEIFFFVFLLLVIFNYTWLWNIKNKHFFYIYLIISKSNEVSENDLQSISVASKTFTNDFSENSIIKQQKQRMKSLIHNADLNILSYYVHLVRKKKNWFSIYYIYINHGVVKKISSVECYKDQLTCYWSRNQLLLLFSELYPFYEIYLRKLSGNVFFFFWLPSTRFKKFPNLEDSLQLAYDILILSIIVCF